MPFVGTGRHAEFIAGEYVDPVHGTHACGDAVYPNPAGHTHVPPGPGMNGEVHDVVDIVLLYKDKLNSVKSSLIEW